MRLLAVLATCSLLALAACGDDGSSPTGETSSAEPAAPAGGDKGTATAEPAKKRAAKPQPPGETVKVGDSDYGRILVDGEGLTLYLFDREKTERSECSGDCAVAWPPLLTEGKPRAAGEADSKLLGTTKRSDGKTQVTYRGHPLYYYQHETEAGQVLCQNVDEFGGLWLVVDPSGEAVRS